jgi:hypothetical protein
MGCIAKIVNRLRDHPELSFRVERDTITVLPKDANGFEVWLQEANGSYVVGFDGWHEPFQTEEEALNCFAFGLSGSCRLKVVSRGAFAHRWTVESKTDTGWQEDSTTGLLIFPFWRRPRIVYRTNALLQKAPRKAY